MHRQEWHRDTLLGHLPARVHGELLNLGTPVTYRPRHPMVRQGEDGRHALLLLAGAAKVVVHTELGRDVLVAFRSAGDLVGEMAVLEDRPRSASVIAMGPVRARLIHGQELTDLMRRNGEICLAIAWMVSARLRWADRRRVEFVALEAPLRIGRVLVDIVSRYGRATVDGWDLGMSFSQTEIASLAGVALGTVEKALQTMQREGLLRRYYRRIVITDLARLQKFSGVEPDTPY
ncbi:Crp/Fnr family transcriptional regulator [Actinophytocola sp.]|uniref:Crp/Fnr family transcriptional regulator n=1 Tax=Actinophytocola sp. TaxID=1872138 RepID=UPI002E19D966